ncbi:MAG: hypothetical protein QG649_735 [Patescibacteria group bacterium]|jgi:hypothetical protein|nr:hypothetical protein [Patescibacteria group bacterium]
MVKTAAQKMYLRSDMRGMVLNPPESFTVDDLGFDDPAQVIQQPGEDVDFVILFVENVAAVERYANIAAQAVGPETALWVAYPKLSGKLRSDISRDQGWSALESHDLLPVTQISLDDDWSLLRFKRRVDIKTVTRRF